jgi:uncharacterized OB-fold protein
MTATAKPSRPAPVPGFYIDTTAFWAGARLGKLMLQYCTVTHRFQHYPRPVSVFTSKRTLEWREASGQGTLYSWTVTRSPWPGNEARVPYICAQVDLDEGVRFLCNLVDCRDEELAIGMRMTVSWDRLSDELSFPDFKPLRGMK